MTPVVIPGKEDDETTVTVRIPLPPRSLHVLSGPARHEWNHGIERTAIVSRRIAITLRELTEEFLDGGTEEVVGREVISIAGSYAGTVVSWPVGRTFQGYTLYMYLLLEDFIIFALTISLIAEAVDDCGQRKTILKRETVMVRFTGPQKPWLNPSHARCNKCKKSLHLVAPQQRTIILAGGSCSIFFHSAGCLWNVCRGVGLMVFSRYLTSFPKIICVYNKSMCMQLCNIIMSNEKHIWNLYSKVYFNFKISNNWIQFHINILDFLHQIKHSVSSQQQRECVSFI